MRQKGLTVRAAAEMWVGGFNAIPQEVVKKLMRLSPDEVSEITPPALYDRIYTLEDGLYGEIVETFYNCESDLYRIRLDGDEGETLLTSSEFEVQNYDTLPMWGTMWTFGDPVDRWWLEENEEGSIQQMADCGFRIYEQEDLGMIFGIDGAGYDFYGQHWVPLYKARGLQWHDPDTEVK